MGKAEGFTRRHDWTRWITTCEARIGPDGPETLEIRLCQAHTTTHGHEGRRLVQGRPPTIARWSDEA